MLWALPPSFPVSNLQTCYIARDRISDALAFIQAVGQQACNPSTWKAKVRIRRTRPAYKRPCIQAPKEKEKVEQMTQKSPQRYGQKGLAKLVRGHKATVGKKDNFRGPEVGQTLPLLKTKLCVPFNPTPKHCKQVSYCGYYWDQHINVNSAFRTWYILTETISNRGEWPEVLMIPGETPTKPGTDSGRAERSIEQCTHSCIPCSQHLTYVCGRSSMSWVSVATKGYKVWPRLSQHTRIKADVSVTRSHSTHTELNSSCR